MLKGKEESTDFLDLLYEKVATPASVASGERGERIGSPILVVNGDARGQSPNEESF